MKEKSGRRIPLSALRSRRVRHDNIESSLKLQVVYAMRE
jgi:hypothetical protein